jgi:ribulose kinase
MCSLIVVYYFFGLFLVPLVVHGGDADVHRKGMAPHKRIVIGVDGGTESIRACCFDAQTGAVVGSPCAIAYSTHHPHPGWAEQDPESWWKSLGQAVRGAVASLPNSSRSENNENCEICSIALDTTCCSVVALDDNFRPLRPCLLWMDQRSATQTRKILELARGDPALLINGNGEGPVSAEWMTSKALWIRDNEPDIWKQAAHIGEYQDYMNYKVTGHWVASSCNAASRWHWNGEACLAQPSDTNPFPGRPMSLYKKLGIPELAEKLPSRCLAMGERVGYLTPEAAAHLGLPEQLPVIQGGPDAFVGMIGLGCIHPGQLCLITGSSHLHCVVTSHPTTAPGTWGAYRGAPLPGLHFAEGGQAATGSTLRWAKERLFGGDNNQQNDEAISYMVLDEHAAAIPPGANGLVALETFQGSRTPVTDPLARGALIGLTLSHTRAHVWRAMLEAVCFGTRACIEGLEAAGHPCDEIILAGGVTRSDMWLQMHADVTGKTVLVCENCDAPLLGSAILASVGVGIHKTVEDAVNDMVRVSRRIYPNQEVADQYDRLYKDIYSTVFEAVKPISHTIHQLRGGGQPNQFTISPSLLACDWANIREEVHRCMKAGLNRFHVGKFSLISVTDVV